jgi:hypothetical protein
VTYAAFRAFCRKSLDAGTAGGIENPNPVGQCTDQCPQGSLRRGSATAADPVRPGARCTPTTPPFLPR